MDRCDSAKVGGYCQLSRQNLAALCTTASQNLAAVSGSHSLTETVDLGTMTLGGLVGTLHVCTTPFKITYARQVFHCSNTNLLTIHGHARVL